MAERRAWEPLRGFERIRDGQRAERSLERGADELERWADNEDLLRRRPAAE